MVIEKKIKLRGSKGEKELTAVFDSGATYSCIRTEIAKELDTLLALTEPIKFVTAESDRQIKAESRVLLDFYINGYRFSDEFIVIENLSEDVIIGATTMQKWRLKLDFEKEEVIIDPKVTKLRLL